MKITKQELTDIIKEEVEKALGEQEDLSAYLAGLGIPLDKNGNPTKRPPLPKNWRSLPTSDVKRQAFRMWYTEYGPGSKRKKTAPKKTKSDLDKILDAPSQKAAAKISDPRSVANAALGHIGSKQGQNIFDDRVLKLHKFWVGKGYKDLDKKRFLEYEQNVFLAAAYLQLDKMRSSGELPDGAYPEVKEVVKMVSEFPSKKFERYAEAGAGYYSSSVGIPMLYKGPTEQEIRLLNQHGAMMKRHRKAVSKEEVEKAADTIDPEQFRKDAEKQTALVNKFVQAKKEFNEKLGVEGRKDYLAKSGVLKTRNLKLIKKAIKKYDNALRHYKKTGEFINILQTN